MKRLWFLLLTWICLNSVISDCESANNLVGTMKSDHQKPRKNFDTISMKDTSDKRPSSTKHFTVAVVDKGFDYSESQYWINTKTHTVENILIKKDGISTLEKVQRLRSTKNWAPKLTKSSRNSFSKDWAMVSRQFQKTISQPKRIKVLKSNLMTAATQHRNLVSVRPQKLLLAKEGITLRQTMSSKDIKAPLSTKEHWNSSTTINETPVAVKYSLNCKSFTQKQKKRMKRPSSELSSSKEKRSRILRRKMRSSHIMKELTCHVSHASCQGRCSRGRDFGAATSLNRCGCDPFCDYFQDCCHDYVKYCHHGNTANASKTARTPNEKWTCRDQTWLISSCPDSWKDRDIKTACTSNSRMTYENYKDVLPVTSPDNKTYANRFCAHCHGVQENQLAWYELDIKCSITPSLDSNLKDKLKFIFKNCQVTGQARLGIPRRYCYEAINNCTVKTKYDIVENCTKGNYGLVVNQMLFQHYKNRFCAICNKDVSTVCGPSKYFSKRGSFTETSDIAKSLSVIMRITESEQSIQTYSCSKGMIYDVYSEMCRVSLKVPEISHPQLMKYQVVMWLRSDRILNIRRSPFTKETLLGHLSKVLSVNTSSISELALHILEPYLLLVEFELNFLNASTTTQDAILDKLALQSEMRINIDSFNGTIVKSTVKPLTCAAADTYLPSQYHVIPGQFSVFVNLTGEVLDHKDYFSTNTTLIHGYPQPVGPIIVCRLLLPGDCTGNLIFLERHEYVMHSDRSLLYTAQGHTYQYNEYTVRNGSVMICTDLTKDLLHERTLTILTYVGFSISIVCLFLVLVTYSLFPKLRTIPGINLMNLCCALFVAHLLWLVGSGLTADWKVCTGIAIVLHYCFLASFVWMSIIAFETWKTFTTPTLRLKSKNVISKHTTITMVIGWIPLAVFVSVCVAFDQSGVANIGYGGKKFCWINNPLANVLIFATPVAVSLTVNAVLFVMITRRYVIMRKKSKLVFSHHRCRQDCTIFARIAASMGFSWIFGFLAPFTTMYLMYPFVIFNTLQGLILAVSFLCTRKVKQMYKDFWAKNTVYAL